MGAEPLHFVSSPAPSFLLYTVIVYRKDLDALDSVSLILDKEYAHFTILLLSFKIPFQFLLFILHSSILCFISANKPSEL